MAAGQERRRTEALIVGGSRFELTLAAAGGEHVWLLVAPGRLVLSGAADDPDAALEEARAAAAELVRLAEPEAVGAAA
jgi:hypothetical protein